MLGPNDINSSSAMHLHQQCLISLNPISIPQRSDHSSVLNVYFPHLAGRRGCHSMWKVLLFPKLVSPCPIRRTSFASLRPSCRSTTPVPTYPNPKANLTVPATVIH